MIFVYRRQRRWGSIARSRDPGLHGRKAVFRTPRDLALSYVEPLRRFHRPGHRICGGRPAHAGGLRLAAVGEERLEGGAGAARLPAPADPLVGCADRPVARALPALQGAVPGPEAGSTTAAARRWTDLPKDTFFDYRAGCQSRSKSRVGFVIGSLPACLHRLLESLGEIVVARPLGLDGSREERFAPRRLVGEDPLRMTQLRPSPREARRDGRPAAGSCRSPASPSSTGTARRIRT